MKSLIITALAILLACTCNAATLGNPDVAVTVSHPDDSNIGVVFTGSWTDSPAFTVASDGWTFSLGFGAVGPVGPNGMQWAEWPIVITSPQYGTFSCPFSFWNFGNGGWVEEAISGAFIFSIRINDFAFNLADQTYRGNITGGERNVPEPGGWLAPLLVTGFAAGRRYLVRR